MNLIYIKYLPLVILFWIIFSVFIYKKQQTFYKTIEKYWFFKKSKMAKISLVFYLLSSLVLLLSLLDFRGKEENIVADIPDQKTIIIIDSSSSMLVEDVRPNRFKKSLLMARHFVKKSFGHQIAIVLFSDTQKRLVPFTDDIDLLDARISGLEKTDINRGGSNIFQAIRESIQYFKVESGGEKIEHGNILVFTDSEDNSEGLDISIPDGINLAVVGVGTLMGGPIPIRTKDNRFQGYKKYKSEKVISKLNEEFLKSLKGKIKRYKYWIASSYTLPTDNILSFFRTGFKKSFNKGSRRIRPVLSKYILIPGIILYILSIFFRSFKSFALPLYLILTLITPHGAEATDEIPKKKEKKLFLMELDNYKKAETTISEKLKLAEKYLKDKQYKNALIIYNENIKDFKKVDNSVLFNYGTSYLALGNILKGSQIYSYLKYINKAPIHMQNEMRDNLFLSFNKKDEEKNKDQDKKKQDKKDQEKKDQKEKDKKDKKDQDKKDEKDEKDKKDQDKENKENKDNKDNKENKEKKDQKKNNKENKGESKKDSKKDSDPKENKENKEEQKKDNKDAKAEKKVNEKKKPKREKEKSLKEKESNIKKKRKMVKIPAKVKQILNDDRQLQERYMNTSTRNRKNRNKKKDW